MKRAVCTILAALCLLPLGGFRFADGGTELPIIMYHSVSNGTKNAYVISPETLEADLTYLKDAGYTSVLPAEVIDFVENGKPLPEKPVMLTFDDGHYNFAAKVLPELIEHGFKAVVSIVGSYTDREEKEEKRSCYYSYLNRRELTELAAHSSVEIQNHSYRLHSGIGAMPVRGESYEHYAARFTADLLRCDEIIREAGGNPNVFTCPFGKYNDFTVRAVKAAGYKAMLICEEGINKLTAGDTEKLFRLKRFNRPSGIPSERFFNKRNII